MRVFLDGDEGVGQEMGFLELLALDDHVNAVRGVLPVAFVVEDGVLVQTHQGIQVCVGEGVAGHLEVPAEQPYAL